MREIKFRGKTINEGEWVESMTIAKGTIKRKMNNVYMEIDPTKWKGVDPDTVGQFTGLEDSFANDIYEHDIVKTMDGSIGVILWFNVGFGLASYARGYDGVKSYTSLESIWSDEVRGWEVVGNIYDNPELLN